MFNSLVHFVRNQSSLKRTIFGLIVAMTGFTIYDDGYVQGLALPLLISLYIIVHAIMHDFLVEKEKG